MKRAVVALAIFASLSVRAADTLRIVSAGPVGETASLAEANEVRAVFSEPMVVLGRIPPPVVAPFFKIEPAVKGAFRWSGTTTLIFTPGETVAVRDAVRGDDRQVGQIRGREHARSALSMDVLHAAIRLLNTDWYRKDSGAVVIALHFNQPVDAEDDPSPPADADGRARGDLPPTPPDGAAKRAKAIAAAASNGQPILAFVATDWNKKRFRLRTSSWSWRPSRESRPTPGSASRSMNGSRNRRAASAPGPCRPSRSSSSRRSSSRGWIAPTQCDPEERNCDQFPVRLGIAFRRR